MADFDITPDGVAAKIGIEVPANAATDLRQIAKEAENFRVQLEAIVRAETDFIDLMNKMPEIANTANQAHQSMASRLGDAFGLHGRDPIKPGMFAAPRGSYVNPFSGMTAGMGRQAVEQSLDETRKNNPYAYVNFHAQHGALPQNLMGPAQAVFSDQQIETLASKIAQSNAAVLSGEPTDVLGNVATIPPHKPPGKPPGTAHPGKPPPGSGPPGHRVEDAVGGGKDLIGRILQEFRVGGTLPSTLGAGRELLGGAEGRLGGMGGDLATLGRFAGVVGGGLGVALGGNELLQMGGSVLQGYRNQGSIRGGGISEGMGYEMQARTMALNPFITTEQARQIMQSALSEGYTGKEFDTVTQFMSNNLREMNMSVGESTQLLRKGVDEAHGSVEGLSVSLAGLKEMAKGGAQSLGDLQKSFEKNVSAGAEAGLEGGVNLKVGQVFSGIFGQEQGPLKGIGSDLYSSILSNPRYLAQVGAAAGQAGIDVSGLQPSAIPGALSDKAGPDTTAKLLYAPLQSLIAQMSNSAQDRNQAAANLVRTAGQQYGINLTPAQARALIDQFRSGGQSPIDEAMGRVNAQAEKVDDRGNPLSLGFEQSSNLLGDIGSFAKATGESIVDFFKPGPREGLVPTAVKNDWRRYSQETNRYQNPIFNEIQKQYGGGTGGIELVDDKGQTVPWGDEHGQPSKDQMDALTKGSLRWRPRGSHEAGLTLAESSGITQESHDKSGGSEVHGELKITVDRQGQIHVPPVVPLTPAQIRGQAGYGSGTPNNPDPGESGWGH